MIYLFYGEDNLRSREKLDGLLKAVLAKKGEAAKHSFFEIDDENFNEDYFKNLAFSSHLFGEKNLVVLKNTLKNETAREIILKSVKHLKESQNIFAFLEEKLEKETLKIFQKEATKILEFKKLDLMDLKKWAFQKAAELKIDIHDASARYDINVIVEQNAGNTRAVLKELEKMSLGCKEKTPPQKQTINIFKLTDAIAEKNKIAAWIVMQKLLLQGENEEQIFWKIFWQIKNLACVKPYEKTPIETIGEKIKLHPFVLKKTVAAAKKFSVEDLERLAKKMAEIYQNNRFNKIELNIGLEQLILNL